MKYAIITPTFEPHFQFIKKYIESFNKFVIDKENITILFTISKKEEASFRKIVDKYRQKIKFEILFFEDILKNFGIKLTPQELLLKYDKFTFQTLKKFYTMLYSKADRFLVLDSESMWIKETNMEDLFNNFFNNPYITGSSVENREFLSPFTKGVIDNIDIILNQNCDKWFLENFVWFYDKQILNDLFEQYGSPIELANKIYSLKDEQKRSSGIFEIELYQAYIYNNKEKYNYNFIDSNKLLVNNLSEEDLTKYLHKYNVSFLGNCGLLEHSMMLLDSHNYELLGNIFKSNKFNIIRCETSSFENYKLQQKFISIVQPNILAASQEHAFGINKPLETLVKHEKLFKKFQKHICWFFAPVKHLIEWLIQPISITSYLIKIINKYFKYLITCK